MIEAGFTDRCPGCDSLILEGLSMIGLSCGLWVCEECVVECGEDEEAVVGHG